ncbi:hypothetical protein BZA70DRAFT_31987 [Myxozyma melibiosi]|uniref:C2H2-type domain-containing protein n=1 Tax=Myxozyma melibiosi TaxID=54550 RepID=A0ABR1FDR3_9ASCO
MASSSSSSAQPSKSQQPSKSTRTDGVDILNSMLVLVASPSVTCRRSRPADDSRSCPTARAVRSLRRKLARRSSSSESVTSSANSSTSSLSSSSSSTFSGDTLADSFGNLTLDKAVPAAESSSCAHPSTSTLSPISHDNTHTKCRKCTDADSVPALCNQLRQLCVRSRAQALCADTASSSHPLNEKLAAISLSSATKPEFTVATSSVCNDDDGDDDSDRENGGALAESSREVEVSSSHDTKVTVYAVAAVEEQTMSEVKDQRRQRQEELDASIAELSKFLDEPSTLIAAASSSLSSKTDEIATESQLAAFNDLYSTYTTITLSKGSSSSRPAEEEPSYIFTTAYAQQILLQNGYTGILDSADALEAFNRLMATGSLETEPTFASSAVPRSASPTISSILAGKPGVAHAPALSAPVPINASGPGSSPHSSSPSSSSPFGRLLAPPSPPLEETLIEDELESMSSIFDLGAAADSPSTLRDAEDPLVERFRAIRGMNRVFPGLGSRNSSGPSFGSDVRGSNQVASNSGNPMSISRLMSQEPTPTSSSTSQGYQSSTSSSGPDYYSGIGGIGSFLAAAAAGSNTGSDLGHGYNRPVCGELSNYTYSRRRASSVAGSRTSQDDEEEDGNVSTTSSNYAATTASTASSTVSVMLPALSPPPLVNFSTHPVHRQRSSVTPEMQQRSLALSSGLTSPSGSLSVTTQVSNTSPKPSYSPSPSSSGSSAGGPQRSRPRKQQCPECSGWFSNLAAHSAVHMAYSSRPYSCSSCGRGFSRPNDLLRHQKAHQGDSPFACPYYHIDSRCHSSGGFSRCDTYKNHLRAMHFEYPAGIKKKDRNGAAGKCKGCNRDFRNADEWIATHVETGECPELNTKLSSAGSSNNDEKKN